MSAEENRPGADSETAIKDLTYLAGDSTGAAAPAPRDEYDLSTSQGKSSISSRIPDSADDDPSNISAIIDETPVHNTYACAGDPLGLPARIAGPGLERLPVSRIQEHGPVDATLSVEDGPIVVTSTPEEVAEATAFYDTWTQNETEGQRRHAKARSTVFSIMQYRSHPDTGETLMTEEQWEGLISELHTAGVLDRHAAIKHDLDTLPDGSQKPRHFHGVVKLKPGGEKQARFIAKRASIPASRIDAPARSSAEGKVVTGPKAADLAFFDLCLYLTHEDDKSPEAGKHLYPRERVKANFDFAAFINAGRPQKAKRTKTSEVDVLAMRIQEGELTLKQALDADALSFNRAPERMEKSRATYLRYAELGSQRVNYYFGGPSGTGKTYAATMFAEALGADLYPELSREELVFNVGRKGVEFQQYDGQPIVIWDDFRVGSIVHAFGGTRDAVWAGLDVNPNRSKVFVNRKYGSVRLMNVINIITGVDSYGNFIENLAGNYKDKDGNEHEAEDPIQAYRRMPFVVEVTAETVSFYLNQGFADTGTYRDYSRFAMMRTSMRYVAETLEAIEDDDEREVAMLGSGQYLFGKMVGAHRELRPKRALNGDDALSQIMGSAAVLTGCRSALLPRPESGDHLGSLADPRPEDFGDQSSSPSSSGKCLRSRSPTGRQSSVLAGTPRIDRYRIRFRRGRSLGILRERKRKPRQESKCFPAGASLFSDQLHYQMPPVFFTCTVRGCLAASATRDAFAALARRVAAPSARMVPMAAPVIAALITLPAACIFVARCASASCAVCRSSTRRRCSSVS